MNISYKWLKRYIDFDMSPRELAAAFTSLGLECDQVEEIESIRGGLRGLVVGEVLTCVEHPDSDHLHITTVNLGDHVEQIVCGAPNVAAGQKVIVATLGCTLYDGDKEFQIKKSKIRGVESKGMICAEDEIGLGHNHDGIMVLDADAVPGTPASEYFNIESDFMLEVELTPNRVDAASHYGCARDLRALLARRAFEATPDPEIPEVRLADVSAFEPQTADGAAKARVEDVAACPRYSGVTVRNVKVQESPEWLRNLLVAAGQRPINNIVDITNFILLGLGQPLHCFDLNKVAGEEIVVRTCPTGTKFTTLDGVEHTLDESDLMICDAEKPMCIAGVFGGLDSGVTEQTTDVFIESAWFNPTRVRRTARRHGLSTDASFRYERGTDPNITVYAAKLAALMIRELAGGEICGEVVDCYPEPVAPFPIELSIDYCNKLIGKEIPLPLIKLILKALEIELLPDSTDDVLKLQVPRYRVDVTRPCDVVEEILRVYGYNNVEFGSDMHINLSHRAETDDSYDLSQLISDMLTAQGFTEILNNSLTAEKYYADSQLYPIDTCVRIINPLSNELCLMRRTLLFGGLESIAHNLNRKAGGLKMYEFGNIYSRDPQKESTAEKPLAPFAEQNVLGIWMTGPLTAAGWNKPTVEATVFDLKAIVLDILRRLGVNQKEIELKQDKDEHFSAKLVITAKAGKPLGELGILRRELLAKLEIEQPVVFAQLLWQPLVKMALRHTTTYAPLPKTQPVKRDLSLLLDKSVPFARVEEVVRRTERKLLGEVTLFDVYEGKNLPAGKKSYAISFTLQDPEKTLNDKQIDAVVSKITANLARELGAELR